MSSLRSTIFPGGFTSVFSRMPPSTSTTETPTSARVSWTVSHISQSTPIMRGAIFFSWHHRGGRCLLLRSQPGRYEGSLV